jgi:hypothetical protein
MELEVLETEYFDIRHPLRSSAPDKYATQGPSRRDRAHGLISLSFYLNPLVPPLWIINHSTAFKTTNLADSFTALAQKIINEALTSASRFFETDLGFCFYVLDNPYFHEHCACREW